MWSRFRVFKCTLRISKKHETSFNITGIKQGNTHKKSKLIEKFIAYFVTNQQTANILIKFRMSAKIHSVHVCLNYIDTKDTFKNIITMLKGI